MNADQIAWARAVAEESDDGQLIRDLCATIDTSRTANERLQRWRPTHHRPVLPHRPNHHLRAPSVRGVQHMKRILTIIRGPIWAVRTLHEAHQYAIHRHDWPDAYRAGYARGY